MIERILSLLKENGMTAKQLTEILEINASSVSEWKSGKIKPSLDVLIRISRIFNVTLDWLLTGEGEAKKTLMPSNTNSDKQLEENTEKTLSMDEKILLENYRDMKDKDKLEVQKKMARMLSRNGDSNVTTSPNSGGASEELGSELIG